MPKASHSVLRLGFDADILHVLQGFVGLIQPVPPVGAPRAVFSSRMQATANSASGMVTAPGVTFSEGRRHHFGLMIRP